MNRRIDMRSDISVVRKASVVQAKRDAMQAYGIKKLMKIGGGRAYKASSDTFLIDRVTVFDTDIASVSFFAPCHRHGWRFTSLLFHCSE
jgi:hypothetical protein